MQSFGLLSLLFLSFLQHHFSDTSFPRGRSLFDSICESCSLDRRLRKCGCLCKCPFNQDLSGHQSLWELEHPHLKPGQSFSSVASFYSYFNPSEFTFGLWLFPVEDGRWWWWDSECSHIFGVALMHLEIVYLSTEYQKCSLGCASEATSTDVKMSSRGRRFIGRPGPILLPKQWPKANDLKEGELTVFSALFIQLLFLSKEKKRPSLTPAALL